MKHTVLVLTIALAATAGQAQTIYKSIDPQGNVLYSSEPPQGTAESEQIKLAPDPSPEAQAEAKRREAKLLEAAQQSDQSAKQQATGGADHRASIDQAKKDVESAEQALAQAHEKHLDDYRGSEDRPTDLKQSYYERVREKQEQLRAAQQRLKEAEAQMD
jgi:hypothetical protein